MRCISEVSNWCYSLEMNKHLQSLKAPKHGWMKGSGWIMDTIILNVPNSQPEPECWKKITGHCLAEVDLLTSSFGCSRSQAVTVAGAGLSDTSVASRSFWTTFIQLHSYQRELLNSRNMHQLQIISCQILLLRCQSPSIIIRTKYSLYCYEQHQCRGWQWSFSL